MPVREGKLIFVYRLGDGLRDRDGVWVWRMEEENGELVRRAW